uniref:Uncharacterized protein n=1 Tax=Solanum lycopersicum TaxID=4081 RepID=K4BI05_SOLLC
MKMSFSVDLSSSFFAFATMSDLFNAQSYQWVKVFIQALPCLFLVKRLFVPLSLQHYSFGEAGDHKAQRLGVLGRGGAWDKVPRGPKGGRVRGGGIRKW